MDDRLSAAYLETLMASSAFGLALIDPQMRYVRVSRVLAGMNGLPVHEHLGRTVEELFPQFMPMFGPIFQSVLATGVGQTGVLFSGELPGAPGETHHWRSNYYPVCGRGGEVLGVACSVVEVTEQVKTQEALRLQGAEMSSILESVADAFFSVDRRWHLTKVNRRAAEICGLAPSEMISKCLWDLFPEAAHTPNYEACRRAMEEGRFVRYEGYYPWTGRWVESDIYPTEAGLSVFFREITDRKRAEQALREQNDQLQLLSRRLVEAQEEERRNVARDLHDEIGQILTGAKLGVEVTARRVSEPARGELARVAGLVQEAMDAVRELSTGLRPPMLEDLGLLPALSWHIDRYTAQTGVRVDLRHRGADRRFPGPVEVAAYRVAQEALTNVARHAGSPAADVGLDADAASLTLRVSDHGRGFGPTSAGADAGGTGITGIRERVLLLGGTLSIDTRPGGGTALVAVFPLSDEMTSGNLTGRR